MKKFFIYYSPIIPFYGILLILLYPFFNDEIENQLCLKNNTLYYCCVYLQAAYTLILLILLGVLVP